MNWASAAILSAATFGIVGIIDSHLLSRRMPGLLAYMLPVGVIFLIFGLLLIYLFPFPAGIDILSVLVAVASGVLRTTGVLITLYNLKKEEVSRVIPITYTYPVFVALIAVPLFGDSLGYLQWLAIIIVVGGAIIVSAEKSPSGATRSLSRPFLLLFAASLFLALSDIMAKYALNHIPFWNVYILAILSMSVIFLIFSLRPGVVKKLGAMERRTTALSWVLLNEVIALLAAMLQVWAIGSGPVSLVSTTLSTRPVFVAVYSIILSFVVPGFLIRRISNRGMMVRFAAIIMIVGGISIIYLT